MGDGSVWPSLRRAAEMALDCARGMLYLHARKCASAAGPVATGFDVLLRCRPGRIRRAGGGCGVDQSGERAASTMHLSRVIVVSGCCLCLCQLRVVKLRTGVSRLSGKALCTDMVQHGAQPLGGARPDYAR